MAGWAFFGFVSHGSRTAGCDLWLIYLLLLYCRLQFTLARFSSRVEDLLAILEACAAKSCISVFVYIIQHKS
jgi:hypothetical protein